jgi:hypothetical protein
LKLSDLEKYQLPAIALLDLDCVIENDLDMKQEELPLDTPSETLAFPEKK